MARVRRLLLSLLLVTAAPFPAWPADRPEAEVGEAFERFVSPQNAHDARTVKEFLRDVAGSLWITRGNVIRGREGALARLRACRGRRATPWPSLRPAG